MQVLLLVLPGPHERLEARQLAWLAPLGQRFAMKPARLAKWWQLGLWQRLTGDNFDELLRISIHVELAPLILESQAPTECVPGEGKDPRLVPHECRLCVGQCGSRFNSHGGHWQ